MIRWKACAMFTAGLSIFVGAALSAQQAPSDPPPGPGLDLIQRSCTSCHDIYTITTKRKTPKEWTTIVGVMADRGADVTPEEMQVIEDYLSQNFSAAANSH
jgi:hypothetical protein